tara:strand:+ start:890 stop:1117 length:228 start_codon:yes stop_codon:yes gene_type:complete
MGFFTLSLGGTDCIFCGKRIKEGLFFTLGPSIVLSCPKCAAQSKQMRTSLTGVLKQLGTRAAANSIASRLDREVR